MTRLACCFVALASVVVLSRAVPIEDVPVTSDGVVCIHLPGRVWCWYTPAEPEPEPPPPTPGPKPKVEPEPRPAKPWEQPV